VQVTDGTVRTGLDKIDDVLSLTLIQGGIVYFVSRVTRYEYVRVINGQVVQRIDCGWRYPEAKEKFNQFLAMTIQHRLNFDKND
jgi:hypothetical protein